MRLLAIDTAGPVIGVALAVDDEVVGFREERVRRGSETRLAPWCAELAAEAGLRLADLDGIAVAVGPGAFTGLRVGLATALGLAHAARCPVVPVLSLQSRARRASAERILSVLDARKGRVYAALSEDGGYSFSHAPADVPPDVALSWCAGAPFVATGEGALVFAELVAQAGGSIDPAAETSAADELARIGLSELARGAGVPPSQVRPVYLRRPDARTIAEREAAARGSTS